MSRRAQKAVLPRSRLDEVLRTGTAYLHDEGAQTGVPAAAVPARAPYCVPRTPTPYGDFTIENLLSALQADPPPTIQSSVLSVLTEEVVCGLWRTYEAGSNGLAALRKVVVKRDYWSLFSGSEQYFAGDAAEEYPTLWEWDGGDDGAPALIKFAGTSRETLTINGMSLGPVALRRIGEGFPPSLQDAPLAVVEAKIAQAVQEFDYFVYLYVSSYGGGRLRPGDHLPGVRRLKGGDGKASLVMTFMGVTVEYALNPAAEGIFRRGDPLLVARTGDSVHLWVRSAYGDLVYDATRSTGEPPSWTTVTQAERESAEATWRATNDQATAAQQRADALAYYGGAALLAALAVCVVGLATPSNPLALGCPSNLLLIALGIETEVQRNPEETQRVWLLTELKQNRMYREAAGRLG